MMNFKMSIDKISEIIYVFKFVFDVLMCAGGGFIHGTTFGRSVVVLGNLLTVQPKSAWMLT